MARLALCGHRTKALHGLTLEMVRVVTAALNELVINPAIGHVGLKGGELALWVGGDTRP
jgi:enoyl-CoA hydratase/carnithine racemase